MHGQRIKMERGDVISTPPWEYHDHGKDGNGPMIWLDGLDVPQFQHFPVHFVQHFTEERYPATDIDSSESTVVWPWREMQARLDAAGRPFAKRDYRKADGSNLSLIIGCSAERLDPGHTSPVRQETAAIIYHVISGSGSAKIGDETFDMEQSDTFCVPSWKKYEIKASDDAPLYLYRYDDRPMLQALGFYRNADFVVSPYHKPG